MEVNGLVVEILWGTTAVICFAISGYHSYATITQDLKEITSQNTFQSAQRWAYGTHILTIVTVFFWAVISLAMSLYNPFIDWIGCDDFLKMCVATYHIGKGMMYIVLILRLKIVFGESQLFAYPQSLIYTLLAVITTIEFIILVLDIIFITGPPDWDGISLCAVEPQLFIVGLTLMNDIATFTITLSLFISKLRKVIASCQSDAFSETNDRLRQLLSKYSVLSMVAMFSTIFFMLIIPVFKHSTFTCVDLIINVICLCLLSARYDAIYQKLCCGALLCIRLCSGDRRNTVAMNQVKSFGDTAEMTGPTKTIEPNNIHLTVVNSADAETEITAEPTPETDQNSTI